ncbi:zinc ABC transporter substrate-binding protein [Desulfocastanea catecholica]
MIKRITVLLIVAFLFQGAASTSAKDQPTAFVSVLPQKFFVQQISKDFVDVAVMVQPGASPATYEPKPSQMAGLASSSLYFSIGVPFENAWLDRIAGVNAKMKIIRTEEGINRLAMVEHHHEGEEHHDDQQADQHPAGELENKTEGIHDSGLDPHIWLSPPLVKKQAATIAAALAREYPEQAALFQQNLAAFLADIDRLNDELHRTLAEKKGMKFMVFHPSWGYFAKEYGLEQIAIEIEGKDPKPAQLRALIEQARENAVTVVFAQPQFSTKSAKLIAREIGGEVIFIDPLAEDWLNNMKQVTASLKNALR